MKHSFLLGAITVIVVLIFIHSLPRHEVYSGEVLDVGKAKCAELVELASELSGVPVTGGCPTIVIETDAWFRRELCGGQPCTITGAVRGEQPNVIHMRQPGSIYKGSPVRVATLWRSVLIHEIVHVLQFRYGLSPDNTVECRIMELRAYVAQVKFLARRGIYVSIPHYLGC